MKTLRLEGVRAFRDRVEVPLGKLTLLVGENSTGKSTVLACTRIAWDIVHRPEVPIQFNEDPFELGTYDSIAHYHGGRGKRVAQFTIGAEIETTAARGSGSTKPRLKVRRAFEASFASDKGNPFPQSWSTHEASFEARLRLSSPGLVRAEVSDGDTVDEFELEWPPTAPLSLAFLVAPELHGPSTSKAARKLWLRARSLLPTRTNQPRPVAFAPVRSRPRRTYDPIHQRLDSEGQYIPALLSRLRREDGPEWKRVSAALEEFGASSGLFTRVSVRSLGKDGDPFQLEVDVPGQKGQRNLLDVGYGVSQVLPILVESALAERGSILLLQQPEVHLHPRAQAELGTLLARVTGQPKGPQCVVETHSDYLVDRVAMAVRDPLHPLGPEDVSLLFFSPNTKGVTIHPLRFDTQGNVVDAPPEYRSFFLHEHARYLGIDDEDA